MEVWFYLQNRASYAMLFVSLSNCGLAASLGYVRQLPVVPYCFKLAGNPLLHPFGKLLSVLKRRQEQLIFFLR